MSRHREKERHRAIFSKIKQTILMSDRSKGVKTKEKLKSRSSLQGTVGWFY